MTERARSGCLSIQQRSRNVTFSNVTFSRDNLGERKNVGCSERRTEIKQRRHRRKRMQQYKKRLKKATISEKTMMAEKLRRLTPGAQVLIEAWNLEER